MTFVSLAFALAGIICIGALIFDAISLRGLTRAVNRYVEQKQPGVLNLPRGAPGSVHKLATAFTRLVYEVDKVRARDTELSRLRSDFLTSVAHQLQTPLAQVRWSLEGLAREQLSGNARSLVTHASEESKALVGLLDGYIEVANFEAGRYVYKFETLDVAALVKEVAERFVTPTQAAQVKLSLGIEPGAWHAHADRERIAQVISSLIENAIRYTPAGGAIGVMLAPGPQQFMHIKVSDTGVGILGSDRGNIFEQFYRGDQARRTAPNGNGLALYMARLVARAHGGDLVFENNRQGAGTTFTLSLPIV